MIKGNTEMGKKIVLTGGGTAGHVTPNLALIPELKKAGYDITYIGSYDGIEKKLIADFRDAPSKESDDMSKPFDAMRV